MASPYSTRRLSVIGLIQRLASSAAAVVLAVGAVIVPAHAQGENDPPWLAGRLSYLGGDVRIAQPAEEGVTPDWDNAIVNDVVTVGTNLYTSPQGRAELRIGGHALRLAGASQLAVLSLDEKLTAVQLQGGVVNVRWREEEQNTRLQINVPGGQIDLLEPGRYRIDMHQGGATVTVFQGRAQFRQGGNFVPVDSAHALTAQDGRFSFDAAMSSEFDEWAMARDDTVRVVSATRYVSPLMTGYDDLDAYGRWDSDPAYGTVWFPSVVPAGWAPYRYGRWRWVHPWGWTWVDAAPWGFAPFHYGRWVWLHGTWGWTPGGYAARPVFAPALVAYDASPGLSISLSIGSPPRSWVPLAPWEHFEPHYSHHERYVTQINQTVIINRPPARVPPNVNHQPGRTTDPVRMGRPVERGPQPLQERGGAPMVVTPSVVPSQGPGAREPGRKTLPFERGNAERGTVDLAPNERAVNERGQRDRGNNDRGNNDRNPAAGPAPVAPPQRFESARPAERNAPPERPVPMERVAPVERAAPIDRSTPNQRPQPFDHGPIDRSPPPERQMPVERPVPPKMQPPPVQSAPVAPVVQPVQRAAPPVAQPAQQPAPAAQTSNERRREEAKKFERQNDRQN